MQLLVDKENMLHSHPTPNDLAPYFRRRKPGLAWLALLVPVAIFFLAVPFRIWNPHTLYTRWLIHRLGNDSAQVKAFARLVQATDASTIDLLIYAMYEDKNPRIKARAEDVLVTIGEPAINQLIDHNATNTLVRIGAPAVPALFTQINLSPGYNEVFNDPWRESIIRIGMPAVGPLTILARSEKPKARSEVLNILACDELGYFNYVMNCIYITKGILVESPPSGNDLALANSLLVDLMVDPDPGIRRETAAAIPNLKWMAEKRTKLLVAALQDGDKSVRGQAIDSLWNLQDAQALLALQTAMQDPDPVIRAKVAVALTGTADGKNVLLGIFTAQELDSMGRDYKAVIQAGDETSVPLLIAALFSNKDIDVDILLNSGNNELFRAAEQYAWDNGEYVLPGSVQPVLTWGGG